MAIEKSKVNNLNRDVENNRSFDELVDCILEKIPGKVSQTPPEDVGRVVSKIKDEVK